MPFYCVGTGLGQIIGLTAVLTYSTSIYPHPYHDLVKGRVYFPAFYFCLERNLLWPMKYS